MIKTDCHVHSSFSPDSSTSVEQMVEKALALGFDTFYLTDHMDYDFPESSDGLDFTFFPDAYLQKLEQLKQTYQGKIEIRIGIELGLKTSREAKSLIANLLENYHFDLIIGSTHLVDDLDPYLSDFWENRTVEESLTAFFEATLANIRAYPQINVLGHLDYAVRYAPSLEDNFSYAPYASILDGILIFLVQHRIALEVNTAGFKYALRQPNPAPEIIKRYLELGGDLISIGSDGHEPESYGFCFEETKRLLLDLGVTEYTVFEGGTARKRPL